MLLFFNSGVVVSECYKSRLPSSVAEHCSGSKARIKLNVSYLRVQYLNLS